MSAPSDLYDYVRIEQIDALNQEAGLERIKIITPVSYTHPTLPTIA